MKYEEKTLYTWILTTLVGVVALLTVVIIAFPFIATGRLTIDDLIPESEIDIANRTDFFANNYDVNLLPDDLPLNKKIKYGYELITNTHKYLGPDNGDIDMVFTGNNLACKSCHLKSGTKAFAAPYVGVTKRFPHFSKRGGQMGTVENRINGCMERSMNGKKLPNESDEMQAMVAYMTWLSKDIPEDYKPKGAGFVQMEIPERKVDLAHGQQIYTQYCTSCHMDNGQGVKDAETGYVYPPLAGEDSYNHGAGMHRVLTSARFIKGNMPFGATAEKPILTDDEAYDVAGFINTFNRPKKSNAEKDFPDKKLKPMSTPYGPYADTFSLEQHKFGPFQEILEYYIKEYSIIKTQ